MAVAEHLVGRAAELDSFDRLLDGLDRSSGSAVELVGEPGVGKTRLLAELGARADARGHLVLAGSASELEQDLPFWVFVDALDDYLRGLDPVQLEPLAADVRAELATLFPSLSALTGNGEAAVLDERYRSFRATRDLLELLAARQPVVLLLDDLHWADPASVELLGTLLHRLPDAPVLLSLGVRPRTLSGRLSVALDRAQRTGGLTRLELVGFSSDEAQEFLGPSVDASAAASLFDESGGNPFYLEQLAGAVMRETTTAPAAVETSFGDVEVPAPVAAALAQELSHLSPAARRILDGAAVAGDPFDLELAAVATDDTESAAIDALDELLRLGLVRPGDAPRRFRFRHPLVRRAVYESSPAGWRLGAHERVAERLGKQGAPPSARAHHIERAARQGDVAAVATLREAGEAAMQRAPASAARWYAGALRLLPENADPDGRVELLLARSRALAATGQLAESHAALVECSTIVRSDSGPRAVRIAAERARVEHFLGRHDEARAGLESALAELREVDSPEAVALMIELALDRLYRADFKAVRDSAERAAASASELAISCCWAPPLPCAPPALP